MNIIPLSKKKSVASLVDGMCDAIMKVTRGSFRTAYFGYILLAVLLTNFIASPMVVYAIVSPLLAALCDNTGHSRSQYMFLSLLPI